MSQARSVSQAAKVSPEEWAVRVDLAAAYHMTALNKWDDGIATHISARVPGEEAFLINPFGLFFEEVTASNLVKIDLEGNILIPTEHAVNLAGFVIHSAIHEARPDAGCVMHLHTNDGVAVSCQAEGLMPISQTALLLRGDLAYHDYEGVAVDMDERERLAKDLGDKNLMILRNHGTLTVGANVGHAFTRMHTLERACAIQIKALAGGQPLYPVAQEAQDRAFATMKAIGGTSSAMSWAASRRRLDRSGAQYAN